MKRFAMLALLLGTATVVQAQSAPPVNITLETGSKLWLNGTSNVKDFKCDAGELTSTVTTNGAVVATAKVTVPVAQLECGNGKMNEHMRKALKSDTNPNIEFAMTSYKIDGAKPSYDVSMMTSFAETGTICRRSFQNHHLLPIDHGAFIGFSLHWWVSTSSVAWLPF